MKAEYLDEKDNPRNPNPHSLSPNMFSKFHQPPPPPPQQQPPLHHPHPHYLPHLHLQHDPNHPSFHFSKDSQTSEEADSAAAAASAPTPPAKKTKTMTRSDDGGETIEVARRPRGRPPGSKNKPKPPTVITREPDAPSMSPYILEIPAGADVVESLVRLTRRRGVGLCVLSGSGAVANVTLRQSSSGVVTGAASGGTVTFHGRFELASLSAVVLPGGNILGGSQQLAPSLSLPFGGQNSNNTVNGGAFTVTLSAPQGHIVGGKVVGPLVAAGTVYVVAASFSNPTFHKLPMADEDNSGLGGGGEEGGGQQQVSSPAVSGGGGSAGEASGGGDMGGAAAGSVVMYSCHVGGPDVIWAPTARPPHQHPPPPY